MWLMNNLKSLGYDLHAPIAEAKYRALATTVELIWFMNILRSLGYDLHEETSLTLQ